MKIDRKVIQLGLISIGIILILSTYFLYPKITNKITAEKKILTQEEIKIDDEKSNYFENVEYTGLYNINNQFRINSKKAFISNEEPDIITFGKGIASGFQLAGVSANNKLFDVIIKTNNKMDRRKRRFLNVDTNRTNEAKQKVQKF